MLTMPKQSLPMPVMCGSTAHSTATAAPAASAALPPARKVSIAASDARGWEVAAMPSQAMTGERPGRLKSRLIPSRVSLVLVLVLVRDLAPLAANRDRHPGDHVDEADRGEHEQGGRCRLR